MVAPLTGGWPGPTRLRPDVSDHRARLGDDRAIVLLDGRLAEGKPPCAMTNGGAADEAARLPRTVVIDLQVCGRGRLTLFGGRVADRRHPFLAHRCDRASADTRP